MRKIYAVFGENGLGTTKSWNKALKLKKYLGRHYSAKKCTSLDEAVAYARYHYNEINSYRNLYYDGTLNDEQVVFTKDIQVHMAQKVSPIPLPLVFFNEK